jgi:hypothetical protein
VGKAGVNRASRSRRTVLGTSQEGAAYSSIGTLCSCAHRRRSDQLALARACISNTPSGDTTLGSERPKEFDQVHVRQHHGGYG